MMSSGSMPGPAVGAGASAPSQHGPQHAQHQMQQQQPNTAYSNTNNNGQGTPLQLPARDWSMMTHTIAHYERLEQIGEGTYGQVYKARCKDTDQIVAMKKIRVHHGKDWGMPPTVIREIKILKRLHHPSLVRMMEVVSSKGVEHLDEEDESTDVRFQKKSKDRVVDAREGYKGNLFLVLEYVSHDLTGLMDIAYQFTPVQVKSIFKQLLEALDYMHQNKYVHRDIKSSNILLDHHFRVKLADFGLARCIEPPILDNLHDRASSQEFTNKVITLWYRPPEILLGATRYGPPVDVWSAGCILAELLIGKPLFTGKTEMDQLHLIFDLLGTPSPATWDGLTDLKLLRTGQVTLPPEEKRKEPRLRIKYQKKVPREAMGLLEKLLELDPAKRLSAERALSNRYFLVEPIAPDRPEDLGPIQVKDHFHEFQTKRKRRQAKAVAEKARENAKGAGMDDEQAQEQFDSCYRELMAKVAAEGIDAFGSSSKDVPSSGANRKDKHKDRKDRERKLEMAGRDDSRRERENKKGDRSQSHRDRGDRPEDDRRSKDGESRKPRDGEHRTSSRRDPEEDAERRRRRKEHDERSPKERRPPSMEEGEEKGEGEKRESTSRKDRDRSSRERRSSRDRDRREKDRDRSSRRRDSSDRSRRDPDDESRSRKRRRKDSEDDDRHKSVSSSHRKSSEIVDKEREKGRKEGPEEGAVVVAAAAAHAGDNRGDHRRPNKEDDKDREKGRKDRDDRERGSRDRGSRDRGSRERDRNAWKDRPPPVDQPPQDMPRRDGDRRGRYNDDRRKYDDTRRRGEEDRRGDPKRREREGGRHYHGRDNHPGGRGGGPWNGPPPMDFPPPGGRRGGPGPGGPPPHGHYGPGGGGPPPMDFPPGGPGGPPFRRDDRDGGPPRGGDRDGRRSPGRRRGDRDRDHGRNKDRR